MEIKSTENGTKLILEKVAPRSTVADQLSVRIDGPHFSGMKPVYIYDKSSLPDQFRKFQALEQASGSAVRWQSTEEDFDLELSHRDSLGHICLKVSLRDGSGNPPWSLSTELILELGGFDALVDELESFLK